MRIVLLALFFVGGCVGSTTPPSPKETPTKTTPTNEAPRSKQGSQLDPSRVCARSACGTVGDEAGKPIADAWIFVVRSDDVVDEKSTLGKSGGWVLHMREENSGPRPWKLNFGAPGHAELTVDVPDPLPEEGFKIDVKLKAAP